MKIMTRFLIVLIFPTICCSQSLTQMKTGEEVEKFIKENFKFYGKYKYDSFTIDSANSSYDNFKEADFNHDGIKDLLVFGTARCSPEKMAFTKNEIVVIAGDKNRPRKINFPYGFFSNFSTEATPYPRVVSIEQKDFLVIGYEIVNYRKKTSEKFYDTLSIKNNHLIIFTKHPSKRQVTKIHFKTDHCFGTCPVFEISIDKNLEADYNGIDHVEKKGQYRLKAEKKDWDYLTSLIANLRIEDLKSNYNINWTDHQAGFLNVTFEDGTEKSIKDYGLSGNFGLSILYDYFFELRKF